jgi:hypothetical protein
MAEVTAQVELRVRVQPGDDPTALERAIAAEGRRAARQLYLRVLSEVEEQAVSASRGTRQRREVRWVATLFGRIRILRYRVQLASESFHPLDDMLDLRRGEASRAVHRLVVELSERLTYRDVARVLTELTGEPFTYQHVSRIVRNNASDPG